MILIRLIAVERRARRLRDRYRDEARSLRDKIEGKIFHVPEKLHHITMGELLAQYAGNKPISDKDQATALVAVAAVKRLR